MGLSYTKIDADGYALPNNAATWSCVKDNVTGLIWENKTNDKGLHDVATVYTNLTADYNPAPTYFYNKQLDNTYFDATWFVNKVNTLSLCGATDWRLPNVDELQSLMLIRPAASPDRNYFYPNNNGYYWTAESSWKNGAVTLDNARVVNPYNTINPYYRTSANVVYSLRSTRHYIRLVRGTPMNKTNRYEILGDGSEVLDKVTQLIWQRCSEGQNWADGACTGNANADNLQNAFKIADTRANTSQKAWRLPNLLELNSLVYFDTPDTNINTSIFPNMPTDGGVAYWSSTPYGAYYSYLVQFGSGPSIDTSALYVTTRRYIRLVRDAK